MTVTQLDNEITGRLATVLDRGEARASARIIWEDALGYSATQLITRGDHELEPFTVERLRSIVGRVVAGEPVQYAVGQARFMGMNLKVDRSTLIPRPETAELVDLIIDRANGRHDLQVLDIGTGSGCIAIALARGLRFASVDAIDISREALAIAAENARSLKANVHFSQDDALQLTAPAAPLYDIIVSNPPYVLASEAQAMEGRVLDYEPHSALFVPDDDPLRFYRPIAAYAAKALRPGGYLYFEINPKCADLMVRMLQRLGFEAVETVRDSFGKLRFITARLG